MRALALVVLLPVVAVAQPAAPRPGTMGAAKAVALSTVPTAASLAVGYLLVERNDDGASLGGSLGAVLIVGGVAMGPSAGNLVLGEWTDAATGAGLRLVGSALLVGALVSSAFASEGPSELAVAAGAGGGLMIVGGAVYDVVTAGVNAGARQGIRVGPGGAGLSLTVGL
ncbi:hypothetical protein [Rubrivirga sp.]|uniref:hypothetical protein n=1 Tax=Rubrivirga sp. TaxID=1885344 RepID=UPI003B516D20